MRIVIDLDGTLCPIRQPEQKYSDLAPLPGAVERLRQLKAAGHYVIIVTARNMGTCEGNVGKVLKNVGKLTMDWLDQNGFEYDEIHFGKPNADLYIDDRAVRFESWTNITDDLIHEKAREK